MSTETNAKSVWVPEEAPRKPESIPGRFVADRPRPMGGEYLPDERTIASFLAICMPSATPDMWEHIEETCRQLALTRRSQLRMDSYERAFNLAREMCPVPGLENPA